MPFAAHWDSQNIMHITQEYSTKLTELNTHWIIETIKQKEPWTI